MKAELTKREGSRIQNPGSRIFFILDTGFWILNPFIRSANRFSENSGKKYRYIPG